MKLIQQLLLIFQSIMITVATLFYVKGFYVRIHIVGVKITIRLQLVYQTLLSTFLMHLIMLKLMIILSDIKMNT
jgi:hypothetical protein